MGPGARSVNAGRVAESSQSCPAQRGEPSNMLGASRRYFAVSFSVTLGERLPAESLA